VFFWNYKIIIDYLNVKIFRFAGVELDVVKLNKDFKKYFHEQNKIYPSYGYHSGIYINLYFLVEFYSIDDIFQEFQVVSGGEI
jgi:hypothetical protein